MLWSIICLIHVNLVQCYNVYIMDILAYVETLQYVKSQLSTDDNFSIYYRWLLYRNWAVLLYIVDKRETLHWNHELTQNHGKTLLTQDASLSTASRVQSLKIGPMGSTPVKSYHQNQKYKIWQRNCDRFGRISLLCSEDISVCCSLKSLFATIKCCSLKKGWSCELTSTRFRGQAAFLEVP